ncbi:MAG: sigma-70 family RNA polymerase sigma factor [Myxococcota bacterium]
MSVIPLPLAAPPAPIVALVRELAGPGAPIDALARSALQRRAEARDRRSDRDAALDVVSCWLLEALHRGGPDAPAARAQLVRIWAPKVIRWVGATAGRRVDPEDVSQEVVCRFAAAADGLRDGLAIGGWLWRTTYLVLRETERRSWFGRWLDDVGWFDRAEHPAEPPIEAVLREERLAEIRAVLHRLPLESRSLLWAAYVEKMDRARIAELFELPLGTVNRRLTQARKAFVDACRARGHEGVLP